MSNGYEVGAVVRIRAVFKDTAGNLVDPTTVALRVRPPGETVTLYVYGQNADLVRETLATYRFDVELSKGGEWKYRWISTGTGAASKMGSLYCNEADV